MSRASVTLENYNPSWPKRFKQEKQLLLEVAGQWNVGAIEHVGSTAVPGMPAKPVIDIMFGVESLPGSQPAIAALVAAGYEYWPYKKEVMHWFCKPSDAFRTHHLHLIPYQSSLWQERIRFRNVLRTNTSVFDDYAALKKRLACDYKHDRERYTQAKGPFVQKILQGDYGEVRRD